MYPIHHKSFHQAIPSSTWHDFVETVLWSIKITLYFHAATTRKLIKTIGFIIYFDMGVFQASLQANPGGMSTKEPTRPP